MQRAVSRRLLVFGLAALLASSLAFAFAPVSRADAPGITVFDLPAGTEAVAGLVVGTDGNLWYQRFDPHGDATKIGKITTAGVVTEYVPPIAGPAYYLGAGPDGSAWTLTAKGSGGRKARRITAAGVVTDFALPADDVESFARGSDGNMWFPEMKEKKIGMITPAGTVTEYPTPDSPHPLVLRVDGNLWFIDGMIESAPAALAHITPAGVITEAPITGLRNVIYDMAVGGDGNFYMYTRGPCQHGLCTIIYQLTPAGMATVLLDQYTVGGGGIVTVVVGLDALWFVRQGKLVGEKTDPTIGRMTYAGEITAEYPVTVPDFSNTLWVTVGPDGNVWFVAGTKVGRLQPGIATPLPSPTPSATAPPAAASAVPSCGDIAPNAPVTLQPFRDQYQAGEALAPNFWGPAFTYFAQDTYDGYTRYTRLVQYFDKGRMELSGTTVTSGLLATELITGQIQRGDATFDPKPAPNIPIAGDPDGGLTYATLGTKAATLLATTSASRLGLPITTMVGADGTINLGTPGPFTTGPTVIGNYDFPTRHNVASAFVDYRTKVGLQTIGYAKSEPFLTTVKVGGVQKPVLVQVFERRVLTYTADNPDAFKVEMGNIGQHYFRWRYCSG